MFVVACLLFAGVLAISAVSANNDFDMNYNNNNNRGNAGGLENSLTMLQSAAKLQESISKVPALKTIASLVMERCTNSDDATVTTCHMFDFLSMCADHLTESFLHKKSKKHMMKNHKMTMFVPTDDAFEAEELAFMKDTRNKKVTCSIMQYHITTPGAHNVRFFMISSLLLCTNQLCTTIIILFPFTTMRILSFT